MMATLMCEYQATWVPHVMVLVCDKNLPHSRVDIKELQEVDNRLCTADTRDSLEADSGFFSSEPTNPLNDYW